jgi:hypothetical protein
LSGGDRTFTLIFFTAENPSVSPFYERETSLPGILRYAKDDRENVEDKKG